MGTEPLGPTEHVVISEFAPRGTGGDNDEFLELYNPSSAPVDLSGGNIRIGQGTVGPDIRDSAVVDNLGWGSAFAPEGDAAPTPANVAGSLERKAALLSTAATMEGGVDAARGNGIDSDWNADDFVTRGARDPQNSASSPEAP